MRTNSTSGTSHNTHAVPCVAQIAAPSAMLIAAAEIVTWLAVTPLRASDAQSGRSKFWNLGLRS